MNIAILNAEAGGNKGAEAMLEVLIIELLKNIPDVKLFLEVGGKQAYYKTVFLKRFDNKNIELIKFTPKNMLSPFGDSIKNISYAIDIGGINFHDSGSYRATLRNLIRFKPFLQNDKKLIFFTQDIGPSKKWFNKIVGKYILNKAKCVFARSEKSYSEILNTFKVIENNVFGPFPDSTLLYSPKDDFNFSFDKKEYVLFCPSAIMYSKHGDSYLDFFYQTYLSLRDNYQIVYLVHNFTLNEGNSDLSLSTKLKDLCTDSILFEENISTGVLKSIIKKAKFVISSRYHVVVGAVAQNVPAVAVGWNPKYISFLSLYDKKEWNLDYDENKTHKEVLDLIERNDFISSKEYLSIYNKRLVLSCKKSFELLIKQISI